MLSLYTLRVKTFNVWVKLVKPNFYSVTTKISEHNMGMKCENVMGKKRVEIKVKYSKLKKLKHLAIKKEWKAAKEKVKDIPSKIKIVLSGHYIVSVIFYNINHHYYWHVWRMFTMWHLWLWIVVVVDERWSSYRCILWTQLRNETFLVVKNVHF